MPFFSGAAAATAPAFGAPLAAATLPVGAVADVAGSAVAVGGGGTSFFASVAVGAVLVAGIWMTTGAGGAGCRKTKTAADTPKTPVKRRIGQNQSGTPRFCCCWLRRCCSEG